MKKAISVLLSALFVSIFCFTAFAADDYTSSVILRQKEDVYSVDYVFNVEGNGEITSVTATDSGCILDWNYIKSEAKLYISLASANPIVKTQKIAEVKSSAKIKLTAILLKVNGMDAEAENFIPGDVTGDGSVTRSDLLRLAKYFSGFEAEIDEAASDVTGDGLVTRSDLLRLAKYFSGFDVSLGE